MVISSNLIFARLLNLCSWSAIFLIGNWQKYAYIISKLYQIFLAQSTHAPSTLVWALSQLISAPFASIYIHSHLNLVVLKTPVCKINFNPSWMQKSYYLKGVLCPISLLTNVKTSALLWLFSFPPASPSCQRKPVHFGNRKGNHSPANHSLSLC